MYLNLNALVLWVTLLYSILTGLALLPTTQFAFNLQAIPSLLPKCSLQVLLYEIKHSSCFPQGIVIISVYDNITYTLFRLKDFFSLPQEH